MPIRYWNIKNPDTVHKFKRQQLNDRNLLALQRGVHWQCRQQNLWSAEKKEVTEARGIVTALTTITFALLQRMAICHGEKNLKLKSDVVELLPCVPHPQNKVHRPLVLRDARLGLRQRDLGININ